MARLLGEARVSILPDGTRFKPDAEAQVKKATAGLHGKVKLDLDTKGLDAQVAAEGAKIIAMQNAIAKARAADAKTAEKEIASRSKMYGSMFDQIAKSEAMIAAKEAANDAASSRRQELIARARTADAKTAQQEISKRRDMYASMFDQVAKSEAMIAAQEAANTKQQQDSVNRIAKARQDDILNQQKGIAETQKMYSKMFDDLNKRDKVKVNVDGSLAEAEATTLRERMKLKLRDIGAKVHLDKASATKTVAEVSGLARLLNREGNNSGKGFGSGFIQGLGKSALMQNPGITAVVIAGLAALPAAVGAVGVLGGIALGAGLIFAAEKMVKSQVKNLTQSIQQSVSAAGGKPASAATIANQQLAIQSTQGTIARLEATKKLTAAQTQQLSIAKQRLVIQKQALATSQGQGGTAAQRQQIANQKQQLAMWQQQLNAFNQLNAAVGRLKLAFMQFAVFTTKPLLRPFTDALDYLDRQLRGPVGKDFTNLFKAVAPLVKPVLVSLLEIVHGILPGMTDMLNKARGPLTAMFIGFGKIVGTRLGQWFRDAVPYIKDSAKYLLMLLDILGKAGSYLIKFGGQVAKAFAGGQFKGLGKQIGQMAQDILKLLVPAFVGWSQVMAPVVTYMLELMIPILDFLTKHPAVVKAIFATVAAFMILNRALKIVDATMAITDALEIGGVWAIVALAIVAAAILVIKYWGPISGFFVMLWKHIWSGFVSPIINFFTNTIPHAFGVTLNWIEKNGSKLGRVWNDVFNDTKMAWGHIENAVTGVVKPVVSVVKGAWNEIYKITKPIWNGIMLAIKIPAMIILGLVGELVIGVRNLFHMVWPWLYKTTKDVWGHIENFITGIVKPIVSVVSGAWRAIQHVTSIVWNWMWGATKNIWGHIENFITGITKPIVSVVVGAWRAIQHVTSEVWNWLFGATKDIWGHIENFITGIMKPIQSVIGNAWTNIRNWTRDTFNFVHDHIVSPLNKAWGWITGSFVKGVKDAFKGLVGAVGSIWNGLKSIVAKPINFVITSIWNPFAGFVNKGLSIFGIKDKLPMGHAVKLARGGHVPGYAPGSDTVPAMLSPGEYVLNPTAARAIGIRNLNAINAAAKPGGGQHQVRNAMGHFAGGGLQGNQQLLMDAERYKGHKYRWGAPSNPTTGWDCSSFVGYVLGHDFGRLLPGGVKWNPSAHGPVASQYNNTPGFHLVSHHPSDIQQGDLLVENSGGHVGFGAGPNKMFSAFSSNSGTLLTNANNMTNIYRNTGALSANGPLSFVGSILKAAAQFALNGIEHLATLGLSKVPGKGPMHDLPIAAVKMALGGASNSLNSNPANYTQVGGGGGIPGGNPPGGITGSDYANAVEGYKYLKANLFGGNKVAAAGAVASIAGESAWNPFAVGTGGRGLIGWTPPGRISDAAFKGGMRTQLPAIIDFVRANNDGGAIAAMERAGSVNAAAQIWDHGVERAGINDVHPYGINLGTGIMNQFKASGGMIPGHVQHFAAGGSVKHVAANKPKPLTAAQKAAAADAQRVSRLELKPMAALKALDAHYKAKMARDVRTGNYRDYYGSSLALDDVDKAIRGWVSPLQREHDADAKQFHHWSALAAAAKRTGNQKAFFKDSVQAAKYAAAIARVNMKLHGQPGASASSFVPLNLPVNNSYMTGFGQFGGQFRMGGTLREGILGRGVKTGMSYMMGAGERVVPPNSTAANPGMEMAQTNQLLVALLTELRTANQINKVTAQNTGTAAKGLGSAGRHIL